MCRSITTTSGCSRAASATASSPPLGLADDLTSGTAVSKARNPARKWSWSSAIRTLIGSTPSPPGRRLDGRRCGWLEPMTVWQRERRRAGRYGLEAGCGVDGHGAPPFSALTPTPLPEGEGRTKDEFGAISRPAQRYLQGAGVTRGKFFPTGHAGPRRRRGRPFVARRRGGGEGYG